MPIPFRFAPIPLDLLYDADVHAEAVRLWAVIYRLADRTSGPGGLAVNRDVIAGKLGWTDKTLTKWTKVLVERGYLEVRRRGQGLSNVYQPLAPDPPPSEETERFQLAGTTGSQPSSLLEISNTEKKTADAEGADAWLKDWWEEQQPRPTQSFVAIRGVARSALRSGWNEETLRKAMTEIPVISSGALDLWRSRQKPAARPSLRNAPGSALARGATDRTGETGEW